MQLTRTAKRITLVAVSILVVISVAILVYLWSMIPDFKPITSVIRVHSEKYGETLYIKSKIWGITGDDRVIVVCKSPEEQFEPSSDCDYVYEGWSEFFYGFENDTLSLYVGHKSEVPKLFNSKITIIQNVLSNVEMMQLRKDYKDRGLQTVD